jgi:septal ring factor EnvC (AmiA/AmiB activator)
MLITQGSRRNCRNFASIAFAVTTDIIIGGIMGRSIAIAMVILTLSGCLSSVTQRLDAVNGQLQTTNQTLREIDQRLERLEKLEDQLRATNEKLLNIEQSLKRLSGGNP